MIKKILMIAIALLMIAVSATAEETEPCDPMLYLLEGSLDAETGDINGWGYKNEYGYYVVENSRAGYLTVWYDPDEQSYSRMHPYSSLSCEHVKNGTVIYPVNEPYTGESGNVYIPFYLADLKHPEYTADGDHIYWLLYENNSGRQYLEHVADGE